MPSGFSPAHLPERCPNVRTILRPYLFLPDQCASCLLFLPYHPSLSSPPFPPFQVYELKKAEIDSAVDKARAQWTAVYDKHLHKVSRAGLGWASMVLRLLACPPARQPARLPLVAHTKLCEECFGSVTIFWWQQAEVRST